MTTPHRIRPTIDRGTWIVIIATGLLIALPVLGWIILDWPRGLWSVTAHAYDRKPFTLQLTIHDGAQRTLQFDVPGEFSFDPLITQRSSGGELISARVIRGDREKTTILRRRISAGTRTSLAIHEDLGVSASDDMDYHM